MDALRSLSRPAMEAIAEALESGRINPELGDVPLADLVPPAVLARVAEELRGIAGGSGGAARAAAILRAVAAERSLAEAAVDRCELVWSGGGAPEARNTAVVVQQLFRTARRKILLASYAVEQGNSLLFAELAGRMDTEPDLSVEFFVNIERRFGDLRRDGDLVADYATAFRARVWPGTRLPAIYYDPRAMVLGEKRACLHAKCVVIDDEVTFVSSANFTEAAHERNVEAGLLVRDARLSLALAGQFHRLLAEGRVRRVSAG